MSTPGSFSSSKRDANNSIDREDEYPNTNPPPVPLIEPPPYESPASPHTPIPVQEEDFHRTRAGSAVFTPRSTSLKATPPVSVAGSQPRLRPASTTSSSRGQVVNRRSQEREASPGVRQRLMSQSPQQGQDQITSALDPEAGRKYIADPSARGRSALSSAGNRSSSTGGRRTSSTGRPSTAASHNKEERTYLERRASSLERTETSPNVASVCSTMCDGNPMTKVAIAGGVTLFVVAVVMAMIIDSAHTVEEGTVGIYFVQGALDERISYPGVHWSIPFVTSVEEVTVRPRTDVLPPISATTKDGIQNTFRDIQVISDVTIEKLVPLVKKFGLKFRNALVFDRVNEEVRTFCAKHNIDEVYNTMFLDMVKEVKMNVEKSIARIGLGGIKILNLAIPKPEIPTDIAKNYKQVKVQWTEQLVATQQQTTEQIKKETESIKAVLDAERQKKVLTIDIEKEVLRKQGEKDLSTLENIIVKEREESVADIENYKKRKYAEANKLLYTEQYVKLEMAKHLSNNTKFFFSGENSMFGSLLTGILEGKN